MAESKNAIKAKRISNFAMQIYSSANISTWCFNYENNKFFSSTAPFESDFLPYIEESQALAYAIKHSKTTAPLLFNDQSGLIWISQLAEFPKKKIRTVVFMLGPITIAPISDSYLQNCCIRNNYSVKTSLCLQRAITEIPVLSTIMIDQYSRMLHSSITGNIINDKTPLINNNSILTDNLKNQEQSHIYQTSYSIEQQIILAVKEGNENFWETFIEANKNSYAEYMSYDIADPIRQMKNYVIIITALCSRAAIEAGVSINVCRAEEARYISEVERIDNISDLSALNQSMFLFYCRQVQSLNQLGLVSPLIQDCCNYIKQHLLEKINLQEIAKNIGYSPSYISRKFSAEMGQSISEYINDLKLNHGKQLLINTDMHLDEISDILHYNNRSYFSHLFKEKFQMSPSDFRQNIFNKL
ncbi:MAG: helix-turn-helix transcriptional regulator [Lachnospiraceae bacterium]|nr:helix-turn-helix transcriptional regulator [Lachnospiraceae bacterium]